VNTALTIQLAPNCSLGPKAALLFFGSLCFGTFALAGSLAVRGLWPVLPFAGLEMLVLGWALRSSLQRRHHLQIITLSEERVVVETRTRTHREQVEFPRHWAQVKLLAADTPLHPSRLTIESHGRACEVGSFLTEEERRGLAGRLRRTIGRVNESPPLAGAPELVRPE
jgi:uncharacterized membrane protein